ncbi:MAG: hypothetical protein ACRCXA_01650, partial [Peptostreptococcaceae bacterium]
LNKKYEKMQLRALLDGSIESLLKILIKIQKKIIDKNIDDYLIREQYILNLMNLASIKLDLGKNDEAIKIYREILKEDKKEKVSDRNIIIARLIDLGEDVEVSLENIVKEEGEGIYTKILELYEEKNFMKAKEFLIEICQENLNKL